MGDVSRSKQLIIWSTYEEILESVIPLYVTPLIVPVSPADALMRMPLVDLVTVELSNVTVSTVLSLRPPTEPMERPWPPEQVPPVKVMS